MKTSKTIKQTILRKGPDSLWAFADFHNLPQQAVAQTLSRLAKSGFLIRIRKGVYHYPKKTALGINKPDTASIIKKTPKAPKSVLGGASAFYNLGLTTQVPATTVMLSTVRSKSLQIGKQNVKIRTRNIHLFQGAKDKEIWILEALRTISRIPNSTASDAILKIKKIIKNEKMSMKHLLLLSKHQPPRVRALLGAIAMDIGYKGSDLLRLKNSLNPLSQYKINPGASLRNAEHWNIV